MKLWVHVICGVLASFSVLVMLPGTVQGITLFYVLFVAAGIQYIIDVFGHSYRVVNGSIVPVRNKLHSLPGVIVVALAADLPLLVVFELYTFLEYFPAILAAALDHWILDLFTEGGVYVVKSKVRALPWRIKYSSFIANIMAIVLHVFLAIHVILCCG